MNVIHENVLVEIPEPITEVDGIIIPEEERVVERRGVVVRFGEAVPDSVKTILKNNPTVEYKEYYDGAEVTIEGKNYIVMSYESLLIIL